MTSQNRQASRPRATGNSSRKGAQTRPVQEEHVIRAIAANGMQIEAAGTEWPQQSAFGSPTEQSFVTPLTGQTCSRLCRVGATQCHRADNDYGQFTIAMKSGRPALFFWLCPEVTPCSTQTLLLTFGLYLQTVPSRPDYPHAFQIFWWTCLRKVQEVETAAMFKGTYCFLIQ